MKVVEWVARMAATTAVLTEHRRVAKMAVRWVAR